MCCKQFLTRARTFHPRSWVLSALLLVCIALQSAAHAQTGFAAPMGGTGSEEGHSVAVDASGNVYTAGAFEGTVDFDPGVGIFNLTSVGGLDVFVSKLDSSGGFLWARAMGDTGEDQASGIAVDGSGNVYSTGFFEGTADFNPEVSVFNLISAGARDVFVSKLNTSGNFTWAMSMGGTGADEALGLDVDGSGNVFSSGFFEGTADFDPGGGVFNLVSTGGRDVFVSKLDVSGGFQWAKFMGGTGADESAGIALDAAGNIHTTGTFEGTADFDPGGSVFNLTSASGNLFVSKLDTSGSFLWAKAMGGTGSDQASGIAVDASGGVHTTGYYQDTADFDPGAGVFNVATMGGRDAYISKLDASGDFLWAMSLGGTDADEGLGIAVDALGNVYTTGSFEGTADFDPSLAVLDLTSAGFTDIFVSKLDSSGDLVWARTLGGTGNDRALGVVADDSELVYTTGSFEGVADFDPGQDVLILTSAGLTDIFASQLTRAGFMSLLGDANQDGLVNATDALWMIEFEFGLRNDLTNETSDLNGDGSIDSTDALWATQIELGQRVQP